MKYIQRLRKYISDLQEEKELMADIILREELETQQGSSNSLQAEPAPAMDIQEIEPEVELGVEPTSGSISNVNFVSSAITMKRNNKKAKICICRNVRDKNKAHVKCIKCSNKFHAGCVNLNTVRVGKTLKVTDKDRRTFICNQCKMNDDKQEIYCVCRKPYDGKAYVGCDGPCDGWYHYKCINASAKEVKRMGAFYCPSCKSSQVTE